MAVVERWPLWRGGHCREVAAVERWPPWRGGRCEEVAVVDRWPVWRGVHCREVAAFKVAIVERWPPLRGGQENGLCREVAVVERLKQESVCGRSAKKWPL